jgi:hypothetical protein
MVFAIYFASSATMTQVFSLSGLNNGEIGSSIVKIITNNILITTEDGKVIVNGRLRQAAPPSARAPHP